MMTFLWQITRPGYMKKATTANTDHCTEDCCTTFATIEKNEDCNQFVFGWQYPYSFPPLCPPDGGTDGCRENCSVNVEHAFDRSLYQP